MKYRFFISVALLLSVLFNAAPSYPATRKVQLNIPGCAS